MSDAADKALLPAGLCDVLPPQAAFEDRTTERLLAAFEAHGYERVKPPLIEFEESLLSGSGAALANHVFRLMDPQSHRMMGVRPDMTTQVARIAATRLSGRPRPLRLSYGGEVLRVAGSQLRPERQFGQVGAELIGSDSAAGDAEVILMAVEALTDLGVRDLSVDLALPTLVPAILDGLDLNADNQERLRLALDHKDIAEIHAMAPDIGTQRADLIRALIAATGSAGPAMAALAALPLSGAAAAARDTLARVLSLVTAGAPDLRLTIDLVEKWGFAYYTGVAFTLFSRGVRGELGRGGRYDTGHGMAADPAPESALETATGLTLFTDSLMRALPADAPARRIFLPSGTDRAAARALRDAGWITVAGLDDTPTPDAEAKRLGCGHVLDAAGPRDRKDQ
ncbi:MAG: ATP phosphoribosyltransferase regulatory subunit [Rhodobacterales bacterium]|nr:ATP phosphoribosyltransferase regulatory subunit [Rhodobacterales bacterium]